MELESTRFGTINYKKSDVILMVRGLLGFDQYKEFILVSINGQEPFKWLQSLEEPNLAFLMIDPMFFNPDYIVEVNPRDIEMLGADSPEDIGIFVLITIPNGQPDKMSANLQGPIIINRKNMNGAQLVLSDSGYTTRHSILKDIEKQIVTAIA